MGDPHQSNSVEKQAAKAATPDSMMTVSTALLCCSFNKAKGSQSMIETIDHTTIGFTHKDTDLLSLFALGHNWGFWCCSELWLAFLNQVKKKNQVNPSILPCLHSSVCKVVLQIWHHPGYTYTTWKTKLQTTEDMTSCGSCHISSPLPKTASSTAQTRGLLKAHASCPEPELHRSLSEGRSS